MCGIYLIKNIVNNKCYVGQSNDIYHRWSQHKCELNKKEHANRHLQGAWNKYKEKSFVFIILEECQENIIDEREVFWIKHYDSYNNGYNMDKGGQGVCGFKHTEEEINKMRAAHNPLVVLQFDMNFNFIAKWSGGMSHAAKKLKYTRACIERCCKHTGKQISYKDYYWVYEQEYLMNGFSWDKYKQGLSCGEIINASPIYNISKRICQYTIDRILVKTWDSLSDIRKAGFTGNQVSTICNHRKGKKTHQGYIWTYEGYDFSDEYFDSIDSNYNQAIENRKRKINQYSRFGKLMCTYLSVTEAANAVGACTANISVAAKKHRVSCDMFWEYSDEPWVSDCNDLFEKYTKGIGNKKKTVYQIDKNNNCVAIYESLSDIAALLGISVSYLCTIIYEGKVYSDSYWKYTK